MKYLITGGLGFIGQALSREVLKRGEELCILDNFYNESSSKNEEMIRKCGDFILFRHDIRNQNDVSDVIAKVKPDVIFHLVGNDSLSLSLENPRQDYEVNLQGSMNLLEAVRKVSPQTIVIYSSSNLIYGNLEQFSYDEIDTRYVNKDMPSGISENLPLSFSFPTGCSKGAADLYFQDYARNFGLQTVVFRHSAVYGTHDYSQTSTSFVNHYLRLALDLKFGKRLYPFPLQGNGKQVRDMLAIDDLVAAFFKATMSITRARGEVFNLGGGVANALSMLELFEFLEQELGVSLEYRSLPWRIGEQRSFVADIHKAKERLFWEPTIDYKTGLRFVMEWMKHE